MNKYLVGYLQLIIGPTLGYPKFVLDIGGFRGSRGGRPPTPIPMNKIYVMPHALLSMATLFFFDLEYFSLFFAPFLP
jgi:hypothetical protein